MRPIFILEGIIVKGKNRGKKLGFPTANFSIDHTTPQGTYLSEIEVEGRKYNAITFIGTVDTFDEKDFVAETYILNFHDDIYGKNVTVYILKKLRDNKKFESEKMLVEQMKVDERKAEAYFSRG